MLKRKKYTCLVFSTESKYPSNGTIFWWHPIRKRWYTGIFHQGDKVTTGGWFQSETQAWFVLEDGHTFWCKALPDMS